LVLAFLLVAGSFTTIRRRRLASPTSIDEIEATHPLVNAVPGACAVGDDRPIVPLDRRRQRGGGQRDRRAWPASVVVRPVVVVQVVVRPVIVDVVGVIGLRIRHDPEVGVEAPGNEGARFEVALPRR